ncbi:MAG: DUF4340 domain-containing protein [Treponema sp.]|jgi:hypothetical protein|nr:DUF4340 domain-containing protein [Treponema sp.]
MIYKTKLRFLVGLVGVLALVYAGTWVFEPERVNARNAAFQWVEAKQLAEADRIELSGTGESLTLVRKEGNRWFVSRDDGDYPAKQERVADFLRILSNKGNYPVRSTEAASHERLGLTENAASRILIRGGAAVPPLLDLLVGQRDPTGQEVYLRKQDQNEVRSGDTTLAGYVASSRTSWYNLRLFPEAEQPGLAAVQRLTVYAPPLPEEESSAPEPPFSLSRSGGGWIIEGAAVPELDTPRVEAYIRSILDAEGEDFLSLAETSAVEALTEGRLVLDLGNGLSHTIRVGPLEANRRSAVVSDNPYGYALAEWTVNRIFKTASYFAPQ